MRERYLAYKPLRVDIALIRASAADKHGNLSMEDEALLADQHAIALAARNRFRIIIPQSPYDKTHDHPMNTPLMTLLVEAR